ncbi:glycosyltransferase [Dyadobacter jejuensis]|nr:glycosyltransferase [Dyadobacter jejuensis]
MISIVICSVNPAHLEEVRANIHATIGVPYEVLAYDNRNTGKGICEVYNQGAQESRFPIICFMHEDVQMRTPDWGKTVLGIFDAQPQAGIVGVAGGGYKSLAPSGWNCEQFQSDEKSFQHILQGYKYDNRPELYVNHNPRNEPLSEVVCVDGVWLCTRKELAIAKPFDQQLLKGFHGYDIDFCLSHFGSHKIYVTYDILMVHYSEGNFNKEWLDTILKLHQKWSQSLPLSICSLSEREIYFTEKRSIKELIEQMMDWEYSFWDIHRMLLVFRRSRKVSAKLFFKAYLHLLELSWQGSKSPSFKELRP